MPELIAAVLARDEESHIAGCIESALPLTGSILVIDSGSVDQTRTIARNLSAEVIERSWNGFPAQRNAAIQIANHVGWILFLDADERLTPNLRQEIRDAVESADEGTSAFAIPRRNVMGGRVMRGGGWWPDYQVRLMRPGRCAYDETTPVHETPLCEGAVFALNHAIVHLNYPSGGAFLIEFFRKQLAYERIAASSSPPMRRRAYLSMPVREFHSRFISDRGYLDGILGFAACSMVALSKVYGVWRSRQAVT